MLDNDEKSDKNSEAQDYTLLFLNLFRQNLSQLASCNTTHMSKSDRNMTNVNLVQMFYHFVTAFKTENRRNI